MKAVELAHMGIALRSTPKRLDKRGAFAHNPTTSTTKFSLTINVNSNTVTFGRCYKSFSTLSAAKHGPNSRHQLFPQRVFAR